MLALVVVAVVGLLLVATKWFNLVVALAGSLLTLLLVIRVLLPLVPLQQFPFLLLSFARLLPLFVVAVVVVVVVVVGWFSNEWFRSNTATEPNPLPVVIE